MAVMPLSGPFPAAFKTRAGTEEETPVSLPKVLLVFDHGYKSSSYGG
jgi:hypothetical protein